MVGYEMPQHLLHRAGCCLGPESIISFNIMKTIAITIDNDTLRSIDELSRKSPAPARSRSRIIRMALKEFVARKEQEVREAREQEIFKRHRARIARQARALISEQAKP